MAAHRHLRLWLLLVLTFATGAVDAVSYLSLGGVFAGNMTGNVIILGAAVAGTGELPTLGPAVTLVCFAAGAAVAGRVLRPAGPGRAGRPGRQAALVVGVGLVTAGSGAALFAGTGHLPVAGALAVAMGAQAAVAREMAVKDVTTVVVTSTVTGLAADSPLGAGRAQPWPRRAGAIACLAAGAAAGAGLIRLDPAWALLAAAALATAAALTGAGLTAAANRGDRAP
ncbi:YoaK family protein [Streptomyces specialis]|uniref:YoaK family protein n=1 Tax=Streptomyces specialis TaxID=498367 RepID=UPI00073E91F8|nr:YoaK family protein [Streptomyces specialis]